MGFFKARSRSCKKTPKLHLLNSDIESEHKIDRSTKEYIKSGIWQ